MTYISDKTRTKYGLQVANMIYIHCRQDPHKLGHHAAPYKKTLTKHGIKFPSYFDLNSFLL